MNLFQGATAVLAAMLDDPQHRRLLRLDFPFADGPAGPLLLANALNAEEELSRDFCYTVEVLSDDAQIPLKAVMGKMVTISLVRNDGSLRYFNGHVFAFRFVKTDGGFAFYEMVLKPWLAFAALRYGSRVFQDVTLCELCELTFENYLQRDFRFLLAKRATAYTLAMQHNETDHNHLHRRLEAAGWHYWYEHRYDGHTLCIGDDSTQAAPLDGDAAIAYQDAAGAMEDDGIHRWRPARRLGSGNYAVISYDFKQARTDWADQLSLNQQGAVPVFTMHEYTGAYGFKDDNDADALAQRRMEEVDARGQDFEAEGNARSLQPGRCFTLSGHFNDKAAGEFLVLSMRHTASNNYPDGQCAESHYSNVVRCLRKDTPWRPGRGYASVDTRIFGVQTATVVGPEGHEIHTDKYGRVRLQFHWDRAGTFDQKSSPWVRVMTGWAGANFGHISLPRIGQEVVVQFFDGNCDRPLVMGSVYNQNNMPPWDLPANQTQSGILTRSTQGGKAGHANALRFEDRKGQEQLWLHAERNQLTEVEHDEDKWVGNDRRKTIDHDEISHIKHDRTETVDHNETITVHNDRKERVDRNESVSIGGNRKVSISGLKSETITLAKAETIGLAKALTIGAAYQISVGAAMNTTVALTQSEQVGLSKSVSAGQKILFTAGEEFRIEVGASSFVMRQDGRIEISGNEVILRGSRKVELHGDDVDINPAG